MRKIFIYFILLTFCLSSLPLTSIADNELNICKKSIKIGVSLPLSAGAVSSGEAVKNSILLADEKYDGNKCVEFIFDDDQLLAKNTVTNVNKFFIFDKVDGLIIYGTPTSIAVSDLVEKAKVPMVALSILDKVVKNRQYIVKHWCTSERLNQAIVREVKTRGYKKVAIVSQQNDAMLGLRDLFVKSKTTEIILDDEYQAGVYDFRASASKIRNRAPEAVYVLLYPPQVGVFVKQLREQKFLGDAFGVHNIEDPREVIASNATMVGMWLANGDDTAGENYRIDYLKRFGEETSLGGGSGYDSAKLFIEAAQAGNDLNWYIHNVKNFKGAFGVYNATVNNDFDFKAVIKTVENRGFGRVD